jgi:hypothetical protein
VDETSKATIEQKIVEAKNRLNLSLKDLSWTTSDVATDLLRALVDLKYYYLTHDGDTTAINFEVLRCYFDIERILQRILRNQEYAEHFGQASEWLVALEGWIDDLIKQGYRQVHPDLYASFEEEYLDEDERFENQDDRDEPKSWFPA